jgi:mRNA interferase MazF
MLPKPKAGEIWDVRLDPVVRPEQGGVRPVLVISTDWFNETDNFLVIVVPITGTDRGIDYQIRIEGRQGGLTKNSVIMCEQPRAISVMRLIRKRGEVTRALFEEAQRMVGRMINAHRLYKEPGE